MRCSLPEGYLFEEYPPLQRQVFADEIADRKGIEHPLFELVLVDVLWISDIIEVSSRLLAVDDYAELVEDSVAPVVEGCPGQRLAIAQIRFVPVLVRQFLA